MTPEEAADYVECVLGTPLADEAMRVLVDHARATAHDAKSRGPEYWRGHADGKLEQQATTTPEIVTGSEAEPIFALARADQALARADQALARADQAAPHADELGGVRGWMLNAGFAIRLPPEPVVPPKVGDTVETAAQLDALPVGAIVEDVGGHTGKRWPGPDGWADSGRWLEFPVVVRYLPEATS